MDPINDFINLIKNAQAVKHPTATAPFSNLKFEMAKILSEKGFVEKVEKKGKTTRKTIEITLKYDEGKPAISGIKRISKPGQRIYKSFKEMRAIVGGYGIAIVSTSKGLITDKEARKQKLGGEVICEVW